MRNVSGDVVRVKVGPPKKFLRARTLTTGCRTSLNGRDSGDRTYRIDVHLGGVFGVRFHNELTYSTWHGNLGERAVTFHNKGCTSLRDDKRPRLSGPCMATPCRISSPGEALARDAIDSRSKPNVCPRHGRRRTTASEFILEVVDHDQGAHLARAAAILR